MKFNDEYKSQLWEKVCIECWPHRKYATIREEKNDEEVCSVCGRRVRATNNKLGQYYRI